MLSQKILKALSLSRITQSSFLPICTSCITSHYNHDGSTNKLIQDYEETPEKKERKLKEWRETYKAKEPIIPVSGDSYFFQMWRTKIEFTPWGLRKHLKNKALERAIEYQKFIPHRHRVLGADLALAHFLIYIGGKVKFVGNDKWIYLEGFGRPDIPDTFNPNYVVSEIDASEIELYYEGLENLKNCPRVRWASFARSKTIDDWCVDRIASNFPFIQHLDLSDCPKVSERGLEALYKTSFLRTLIVTNNYKSAAFELTCMMLEDVIPGLQVNIREPKEEMKPPINNHE